jgi:tetratricopeptide (TPR) repeat protein
VAAIAREHPDATGSASDAPLVSVLIPTYNRPALLMSAVASARAQTVADIEILVRDDAGGGNVQGVLAAIGDDRIVYRRNDRNLGDAATNIPLYEEARGKYVAHLDDDDEWDPHFLARLLEPLERHPDVNLAFCNHVVIDIAGRPQWERTAIGEKRWGRATLDPGLHRNGRFVAAVARSIPTSHAAMIRRSALDLSLMDPRVARAWDMHIASLAVRQNGLAWFEPDRLTRYRVHEGQWSDLVAPVPMSDSKFAGLVHCLELLIHDPLYAGERGALRRGLSQQRENWALALLTTGRNEEALDQARAALEIFPAPRALAVRFLTGLANRSTLPVGRLVASSDVMRRRLRDLALHLRRPTQAPPSGE